MPSQRRWAAGYLLEAWKLSVAAACRLVGMSRRAWYCRPAGGKQEEADAEVIDALGRWVEAHPRWGFWKYFHALRGEGFCWNHKRIWRIYKALGLNHKRRARRRLPERARTPLDAPAMPNHTWSLDFMSDTLYNGHRYRLLNVIDEGTREALGIVVGTSLCSGRVVRELSRLVAEHGRPRRIRVDNGPELTSVAFVSWCRENGVELIHIQPGKPAQNAYIERFNRTFRTEVLDAYVFSALEQVRELSWSWLTSYNEERPHAALGNVPPMEFKRQILAGMSSFELCA